MLTGVYLRLAMRRVWACTGIEKAARKFQTFPPLQCECPRWDSNPHSEEPDFESGASANSATRAYHALVRNTFRILTQAV